MSYKYKNHGKIYDEEKKRANQFEQMYNELKKPYDQVKAEAHRLKLNLIKYEEKYKFIDLAALHAETQKALAEADAARLESASYKKDLFDIRNRIMEATRSAEGGKKKKRKQQQDQEWKGAEDVEKLCMLFTTFLTSPGSGYGGDP